MNKPKVYRAIGSFLMYSIFILACLSCFFAGKLIQYYEIYPTTEFRTASYNSLPTEALIKIGLVSTIKNLILAGVVCFFAYEFFRYLAEPEGHWITPIVKKIESLGGGNDED